MNTANHPPILIVSIPKSGTYLLAALLDKLGYQSSGIHIALDGYQKLPTNDEESRAFFDNPLPTFISHTLEQSLSLINRGEFAMSHLPYTPAIHSLIQSKGIKVIFCVRELRAATASHMRYSSKFSFNQSESWSAPNLPKVEAFREYLRSYVNEFAQMVFPMMAWANIPNSADYTSLQFESLLAQSKSTCSELSSLLQQDSPHISLALSKALDSESLTKSAEPTLQTEYWDEQIEETFQRFGFDRINSTLGYSTYSETSVAASKFPEKARLLVAVDTDFLPTSAAASKLMAFHHELSDFDVHYFVIDHHNLTRLFMDLSTFDCVVIAINDHEEIATWSTIALQSACSTYHNKYILLAGTESSLKSDRFTAICHNFSCNENQILTIKDNKLLPGHAGLLLNSIGKHSSQSTTKQLASNLSAPAIKIDELVDTATLIAEQKLKDKISQLEFNLNQVQAAYSEAARKPLFTLSQLPKKLLTKLRKLIN